ncbi:MAG: hypothetical protein QXF12_02345 [Candidatus Aenigmatarchaeota archaeon]
MPVINRSKMDHFIFSYLAPSFMNTGTQSGSVEFFLNYRYKDSVMFLPILDKSSPYLCTVALFDGYENKAWSGQDTIKIEQLAFVTGFFISPDFGEISIDYNWNTKDGGLMIKIKEKVLGTVQSFFRDDPASFSASISAFKDLPGAMSLVSLFFDADKLFGHITNIARYMTNGSLYYPEKHIKAFDGAKIQVPNIKVKKYYISGSSYADPYQAVISDLNKLKLLPMLYNPKSYRVTNTNYITEVLNAAGNAPAPTEAPPANDGAFVHAITQTETFQNIIHMIAFLYYYTNLAINAPLAISTPNGYKVKSTDNAECYHMRFGPFLCSPRHNDYKFNSYYFPGFFNRPPKMSWCTSLVGYTGISRNNDLTRIFYEMYDNNYKKYLNERQSELLQHSGEILYRQFIFSQGVMIAWMFGGFFLGIKDPNRQVYVVDTFEETACTGLVNCRELPINNAAITFFNTSPVLLFAMAFSYRITALELTFTYNYARVQSAVISRRTHLAYNDYAYNNGKTKIQFHFMQNVSFRVSNQPSISSLDCSVILEEVSCNTESNSHIQTIGEYSVDKITAYESDIFTGYPFHLFNDIFIGDYNRLTYMNIENGSINPDTAVELFRYDENDIQTKGSLSSIYAGLACLLLINPEFNSQFGVDNNDWIMGYYLGYANSLTPYDTLKSKTTAGFQDFSYEHGGVGIPMYHPLGHYGAYLSYFTDELFILSVINLHLSPLCSKPNPYEAKNVNEAITAYLNEMDKLGRFAVFPGFKKDQNNKVLNTSVPLIENMIKLSGFLLKGGAGIGWDAPHINWLRIRESAHKDSHPLSILRILWSFYLDKLDINTFKSGLLDLYSDLPDYSLPKLLAKDLEKYAEFKDIYANCLLVNFYNGYHIILGLIFFQQHTNDVAISIGDNPTFKAAAKAYFEKERTKAEQLRKQAEEVAKEEEENLDEYVDLLQRISAAPTSVQQIEESSFYLLNLLTSVALFGFNSKDSSYLPYADKSDSKQSKYDLQKYCQGCESVTSYIPQNTKSYIWYPTDLTDKPKERFDKLIEARNQKKILKLDGEHASIFGTIPIIVFYFMFNQSRTIKHCNFCQFIYDSAYYHNLYTQVASSSSSLIFFNSRISIDFLLNSDEKMDINDMYTSVLFHRLAQIYQGIKTKYKAYFNQAINVKDFDTGESVGGADQGVEFKTQTQAHSELFLGRILKLFNVMLLMPPGDYDYIPYFKVLFTALLNGSTKVNINGVDYYIGYYIIILHNVNAFKGFQQAQAKSSNTSSRVLSYLLPRNVEVKTSEQYTYPFNYELEFQGDNKARPLYVTLEVTFEPINDLLFLYATYGDLNEIKSALGIAGEEIMDDITNVNRSTSTGCSSGGGGGDGTESYGSC